jgi:hypothetical protein
VNSTFSETIHSIRKFHCNGITVTADTDSVVKCADLVIGQMCAFIHAENVSEWQIWQKSKGPL